MLFCYIVIICTYAVFYYDYVISLYVYIFVSVILQYVLM